MFWEYIINVFIHLIYKKSFVDFWCIWEYTHSPVNTFIIFFVFLMYRFKFGFFQNFFRKCSLIWRLIKVTLHEICENIFRFLNYPRRNIQKQRCFRWVDHGISCDKEIIKWYFQFSIFFQERNAWAVVQIIYLESLHFLIIGSDKMHRNLFFW